MFAHCEMPSWDKKPITLICSTVINAFILKENKLQGDKYSLDTLVIYNMQCIIPLHILLIV